MVRVFMCTDYAELELNQLKKGAKKYFPSEVYDLLLNFTFRPIADSSDLFCPYIHVKQIESGLSVYLSYTFFSTFEPRGLDSSVTIFWGVGKPEEVGMKCAEFTAHHTIDEISRLIEIGREMLLSPRWRRDENTLEGLFKLHEAYRLEDWSGYDLQEGDDLTWDDFLEI